MTVIDLMEHPRLLGHIFAGASWDAWKSVLRAEYALPLNAADRQRLHTWAGREVAPSQPVRRSYRRIGRRGGKDSIAALEAVFLSAFRRYPLRVGELGVGLLLAANRQQSAMLHRAVRAFLRASPLLESLVVSETQDSIELRNGVLIEIVSANLTAPRNRTVVWAVCNEVAFWPQGDDVASPDVEILNAIEPGTATIANAKVVVMSSAYAKVGILGIAEDRYFGREDAADGLYWICASRDTNPTIDQGLIDRALSEDPSRARAEYLSAWREDVESFVSREVVLACVARGVRAREPVPGRRYRAFVDPAGGSGQDSFTLAVGHQDGGGTSVVLDAVGEWRPKFSPEAVIGECAQILRRYGCASVVGDRFGGEFPREQFRRSGIRYDVADRSASELYRDALPLLTSGRVALLDHDRLVAQLVGLERRTGRSGKDSISHRPGNHDDVSNAACGLIASVATTRVNAISGLVW